jgi:hypothetical protein
LRAMGQATLDPAVFRTSRLHPSPGDSDAGARLCLPGGFVVRGLSHIRASRHHRTSGPVPRHWRWDHSREPAPAPRDGRPTLGIGIGLGYVQPEFSKPGTPLEIEIRGKRSPAVVVPKPFFRKAG